jgi:hypothetical protein
MCCCAAGQIKGFAVCICDDEGVFEDLNVEGDK